MDYQIDGNTITVQPVNPNWSSWKVFANGKDITAEIADLAVMNMEMGLGFFYGASPTGGTYNQGYFYNRGGSVIVIHVVRNEKRFLMALEQVRPLQKPEAIPEFPRGQGNLGEDRVQTALRELFEETGLSRESVYNIDYLGSGNPDNALILGENMHFVAMEINESEVDWTRMQLWESAFRPDVHSRTSEQIRGSRIVLLERFTSPSMMTMAAYGFLRSHLDSK